MNLKDNLKVQSDSNDTGLTTDGLTINRETGDTGTHLEEICSYKGLDDIE